MLLLGVDIDGGFGGRDPFRAVCRSLQTQHDAPCARLMHGGHFGRIESLLACCFAPLLCFLLLLFQPSQTKSILCDQVLQLLHGFG